MCNKARQSSIGIIDVVIDRLAVSYVLDYGHSFFHTPTPCPHLETFIKNECWTFWIFMTGHNNVEPLLILKD
jgi:hypothetical protein